MSFADTAKHLIDSDQWSFEVLRTKMSSYMVGRAGLIDITNRGEYEALLDQLRESGDQRVVLLEKLGPADFEADRFS